MCLVLSGSPLGWHCKGNKQTPSFQRRTTPPQPSCNCHGENGWEFSKKWSSICKSFIFLGTNTNLASLAKYSSCVLNRSTYSASLSGVGSPFSATSPWRSQSFMGITVQLFSFFPKLLAELKTPLKFFENYSSKYKLIVTKEGVWLQHNCCLLRKLERLSKVTSGCFSSPIYKRTTTAVLKAEPCLSHILSFSLIQYATFI